VEGIEDGFAEGKQLGVDDEGLEVGRVVGVKLG
jgi:hypothetical protein